MDEVKQGVYKASAVEEVAIAGLFPEWVVTVEVAKPDHMVVVGGGGEVGVVGEEVVQRMEGVVVGGVVVDIEEGDGAGGGAEFDGSDVA